MRYVRYGLVGFFILALIVTGLKYYVGKPMRDLRARVERLDSEPEARETLGPPTELIYPGDEVDFVKAGYPCAAHPVTHHALVYYAPLMPQDSISDVVLFLYVNADLAIDGYEVCGT